MTDVIEYAAFCALLLFGGYFAIIVIAALCQYPGQNPDI